MLYYALVFFLIALVAAIMGFGGVAIALRESPRFCSFCFWCCFS